jgi:hypothetical protein
MRSRERVAEFARGGDPSGIRGLRGALGGEQGVAIEHGRLPMRDADRPVRKTDGGLHVAIGARAPRESKRAPRIGEDHDREPLGRLQHDVLVRTKDR